MHNLQWQVIGFDSKILERLAHSGADLYVEFKDGSGYIYFNVPSEIYQRILSKECICNIERRPSYGATFVQLVKKASYHYDQYK